MRPNILITGAAGYIGGSLVADFLANNVLDKDHLLAAVRSEGQAQALSMFGIQVLRLDLTDEASVVQNVTQHNVSIVIHTASSLVSATATNLITALGKQKASTGENTYFLHTSGLSAFTSLTGWPSQQTKDTEPVFETEKSLAGSFPIRQTDVTVVEQSAKLGVTSFIVIPSTVYGKGSGPYNKLSVVYPIFVKASIAQKAVHKFPETIKVSGVHISDLTSLYGRIVTNIVSGQDIPSGKEGYYFALGHETYWHETLDHLAAALKARDLVTDSSVDVWESDDAAAEVLGVPVQFVQALWNSGEDIVATRGRSIGWDPVWDKAKFLGEIDQEIVAVLEEGQAKSSLVQSLRDAASK